MVRELPARLHVFQSILVARTFHFRGGVVFLVLGPHTSRARMGAMGGFGRDLWADARRVLRQRRPADRAVDRIAGWLLAQHSNTPASRGRQALSSELRFRGNGIRDISAHAP